MSPTVSEGQIVVSLKNSKFRDLISNELGELLVADGNFNIENPENPHKAIALDTDVSTIWVLEEIDGAFKNGIKYSTVSPLTFKWDSANKQWKLDGDSEYVKHVVEDGKNVYGDLSMQNPSTNKYELVTFTILDPPAFNLPETGGAGTQLYTIGGLVLMSAAILLGFCIPRKREKEAACIGFLCRPLLTAVSHPEQLLEYVPPVPGRDRVHRADFQAG